MPYTKTLDRSAGLPFLPQSWTAVEEMLAGLRGRVQLFTTLWLLFILMSLLTRFVLAGFSLRAGLVTWGMLPRSFAMGMLLDGVTGMYLCAPFAVYLWLAPRRLFDSKFGRGMVFAGFAVATAGFVWLLAAEYFFFDKFNARFDYRAVEHLRHPAQAFSSIVDPYPMTRAALTAAWTGMVSTFLLRERIFRAFGDASSLGQRTVGVVALTALILLSLAGINLETAQGVNTNRVSGELAENGVYAFFSAMRHPTSIVRKHRE